MLGSMDSKYADKITELQNWLINAFNGEWLKVGNPIPIGKRASSISDSLVVK